MISVKHILLLICLVNKLAQSGAQNVVVYESRVMLQQIFNPDGPLLEVDVISCALYCSHSTTCTAFTTQPSQCQLGSLNQVSASATGPMTDVYMSLSFGLPQVVILAAPGDYDAADAECQNYCSGGRLAILSSKPEAEEALRAAKEARDTISGSLTEFWLGLQKNKLLSCANAACDGHFTWEDGTSLTYSALEGHLNIAMSQSSTNDMSCIRLRLDNEAVDDEKCIDLNPAALCQCRG